MLLLLLACEGAPSGASEPLTVRDATFFEGELPFNDQATTPTIVYAAAKSFIATQGQGNLHYGGLASPDAYSVAVAFPEVSSGYWVVPVDGPDVTQENKLIFGVTVDFGHDVPYGTGALDFVAIDKNGDAGPKYSSSLCVLPDYADQNLAVCSTEIPPQHTIISLRWDRPVDLDLLVTAPDGKLVGPKTPTTAIDADGDGKLDKSDSDGVLSRDSNSNCHIDNFNLESLVFANAPLAGDYRLYASLASACGERSVNYQASLYQRVENEDGSWSMTETELPHGTLLAAQADGGASLGTYLTTLSLE